MVHCSQRALNPQATPPREPRTLCATSLVHMTRPVTNRRTQMPFLTRRTAAELRRSEGGNVLVTTVLVSMVIGALASLALATGRQSDWSSARDRNSDTALGVAEAAVNKVVDPMTAQAA